LPERSEISRNDQHLAIGHAVIKVGLHNHKLSPVAPYLRDAREKRPQPLERRGHLSSLTEYAIPAGT
jgi:hypothetical protein